MSTYDGPAGGVESRTGPSVYVQWEAASRTVRLLNPPMPVMVNMRSIDPDAGRPAYELASTPSLRVRAAGIRFEPTVSGHLMAWFQLSDGQWRGLVTIQLASPNGRTGIEATLYVRPDAMTPTTTQEDR